MAININYKNSNSNNQESKTNSNNNLSNNIFEKIKIVGTSHISKQSIEIIKKTFLEFHPDVIAVELDEGRLYGLLHPNKNKNIFSLSLIKEIGITGYLFAIIGKFVQKKLGSIVKMDPGADMLFGVNLANNNNLELELIDRDIQITLKRFSKYFTFKEKMRLFGDFFKGIFSKKHRIIIDIKNIPEQELINTLIKQVKDSYPGIYKTLIDERNHFMSKKLITLSKKNPTKKYLVIVGAGHKVEMEKLLLEYNKKIEFIG
jgi:pheromone shutdown-related protein TraB